MICMDIVRAGSIKHGHGGAIEPDSLLTYRSHRVVLTYQAPGLIISEQCNRTIVLFDSLSLAIMNIGRGPSIDVD